MMICFLLIVAQTYNPDIAQIVNRVNVDSVAKFILKLQNFWTREYESDSMYKARLWIKDKFINLGYNVTEQIFSYGGREQANIIATKYGLSDTENVFIIDAHYDSRGENWGVPPYGPAPGADDNASGVSLLLEIARIIKDIQFDYTIKFVAFACEEPGLIGSEYLAEHYSSNNKKIKCLLNADMIGGDADYINDTIIIERDEDNTPDTNNLKSWAFADTLKNSYTLYTNLNTVFGPVFGSDYIPFEDSGYTVIGVFEYNWNSTYHSAYDVVDSMDVNYTAEVIKGVLAFILYVARFYPVEVTEIEFGNRFNFKKVIYDISGRKILNNKIKSGIYFMVTENKIKKILKIK